ncbi:hypothetical protein H5410_056567 [Solanum commersonii]|uniref:Small ribosomal subunit protein uS10 domain-containing protein n=1 Tax=Solanum commersonii TaxID=4109 RepID=A0A9J5WKK4_SOLCO|nr:hypothetical protein H5410_056567 [Solanum commersonii]
MAEREGGLSRAREREFGRECCVIVVQKERPPKVTTTKIGIVIRSFDHPFLENHFWGLPPYTWKIGLPESRVLYIVLRSPHIDKKSREQFFMKIKKEFLVIKTERHELRKKFFRLKHRFPFRFTEYDLGYDGSLRVSDSLFHLRLPFFGVMGTCFSRSCMELARPDQILGGNHQLYNLTLVEVGSGGWTVYPPLSGITNHSRGAIDLAAF